MTFEDKNNVQNQVLIPKSFVPLILNVTSVDNFGQVQLAFNRPVALNPHFNLTSITNRKRRLSITNNQNFNKEEY